MPMLAMSRLFLLALAALAFCSGCRSFVPFTHEIRTEYGLSDNEVRNLQFYISDAVTLRREVESGGHQVTPGHKLLVVSGKTIEEVFIAAKTPGVATKVTPASIFVSFEPGTALEFTTKNARISLNNDFVRPSRLDRAFLGQSFAAPPDPFPGNNNEVAGPRPISDELGGNFWLAVDSSNHIFFANKAWEVDLDGGTQAHLVIGTDSLEEVEKKRTVLPGMRLQNN